MEQTQEQPLFEAKQLCFKNSLCYMDLAIRPGQTTFIAGASGTGKSTLLKLFNATYPSTHGDIYFKGQSLEELDTIELRKKVLLIGQAVFLYEGSILDNFKAFYEQREEPLPSQAEMQDFLTMCKVPFGLKDTVDTMSGGERQRVYLAIFMSFKKEVLMLDEPTSALDATTGHEVMGNIIAYCKAHAIATLVVSHDPTMATEFADQVVTLGRVDPAIYEPQPLAAPNTEASAAAKEGK